MGVGYAASGLHQISYLKPVEGAEEQPPPDIVSLLMRHRGAVWDGRPQAFQSPAIVDIVRWRTALSEKYRQQLGEELTWDEASAFEQSEDAGTSADPLLRYVAAVLDQQGPVAVRNLAGTAKPPYPVMDVAFAEAGRRGFAGRFPHIRTAFKRDQVPEWVCISSMRSLT